MSHPSLAVCSPLGKGGRCVDGESSLFQNGNEEDEDDDEDDNGGDLLVVASGPGDLVDSPVGAVETRLVPVRSALDVVEHGDVGVELIADLHAQLALPPDRLAQAVELLVLLLEDVGVILVQLLVVHPAGLVTVAGGVVAVRVIAVGPEKVLLLCCCCCCCCGRGGGVAEADCLAGLAGGAARSAGGGVGEVVG